MIKLTDERSTPWELFNPINNEFHLNLDVCATIANSKFAVLIAIFGET